MVKEKEPVEALQDILANLLKNAFTKANTIMDEFDMETYKMNFGDCDLSSYKIFGDNYESFKESLEEFGGCMENFIEATVGTFSSIIECAFDRVI